jgi:hypothetical protein
MAQSVQRLATGRKVWGFKPGNGEIFRTHIELPWGMTKPPIRYVPWSYFSGVKRPERGIDHAPPSSAEVK